MKKFFSLLLVVVMSFSLLAFAGCDSSNGGITSSPDIDVNNPSSEPDDYPPSDAPTAPVIESAAAFYEDVWSAFGEENQFPCGGGDMDNTVEGPGKFNLTEENAESFKSLLHVTDELYAMLDDDVATLQHMMNLNTFSSAVAKLKDPNQAEEFAEGYKTAIQAQRWMCGFPDKVVVISVGDYVVMAYGHEDNINNLAAACSSVIPEATVLIDAPAMLE